MDERLRVLIVTDLWPTQQSPGEQPWISIPALLLKERGYAVSVVFLRRVFPPKRAFTGGPRRGLAELKSWWVSLVADPPLHPELVLPARSTAPPRTTSHHRWGRYAMRMAGRRILRHAIDYHPDLVHAHFAIPGGWVARDLARHLACGYVVSVHGSDLAFTAKLSRAAGDSVAHVLEDASRVVVNSNLTSRGVDSLCGRSLGCVPLWQGGDPVPRARSLPRIHFESYWWVTCTRTRGTLNQRAC